MQIQIILNQILILSILVLVGIIASKAKVISLDTKDLLAKIIFDITLPLMILTNFSKIVVTPEILHNSLISIVLTVFVLLFMLSAGWITTKILKTAKNDAIIFKMHSVFGNLVYLGFPLIYAVYGEEGLLYASMFQVVSNIFMWTAGIIIINQGNGSSIRQNLKYVMNPNTIAVVIGFTLFLFSVRLPKFILIPLGGLGDSNSYLSMLYIGTILFYTNIKGMFNNKIVYILSLNKLLMIPATILIIFRLMNFLLPVKIDPIVIAVLILQAAMPCMVNIVIMAKIFGANDELATANVFISTLFSILTLPLILLLIGLTS
jgi:malate permease and related proteins